MWGRSWVSADKQFFCKLSTEIINICSNVCTSRLDLAVVMPSQNKSSLHSIIAKGVKTGTNLFLPQNSHQFAHSKFDICTAYICLLCRYQTSDGKHFRKHGIVLNHQRATRLKNTNVIKNALMIIVVCGLGRFGSCSFWYLAFVLTIIIEHFFQILHDEGVVAISLPTEV